MKKRAAVVCAALMCLFALSGCINRQYNAKGLSRILTIMIDETQPKEYVGELDDHRIFVEGLKLGTLYFVTIDAETVSLQEAIEKGLTSIDDWRKGAFRIRKEGDAEILQYENYEIAIAYSDCVIRPLVRTLLCGPSDICRLSL